MLSEGMWLMPCYRPRRKIPALMSEFNPSPPEQPVGPLKQCAGCRYSHHGLICWRKDGTCLRTDMREIEERSKKAHGT